MNQWENSENRPQNLSKNPESFPSKKLPYCFVDFFSSETLEFY